MSDEEEGGSIRKAKKKSPKRNEKIEQALATRVGGSIRNVKKKSPKKNEKIAQALKTRVGGGIKFHDRNHEYLYNKLSGKGGHLDSPECRKMMHSVMEDYHPSLFNSYINGRVMDAPKFIHDHKIPAQRKKINRRPDVINYGGSLNAISHSENGLLISHDSRFHNYVEIV